MDTFGRALWHGRETVPQRRDRRQHGASEASPTTRSPSTAHQPFRPRLTNTTPPKRIASTPAAAPALFDRGCRAGSRVSAARKPPRGLLLDGDSVARDAVRGPLSLG